MVALNRAVAVSKTRGPEEALQIVEPLEPRLNSYFHFHGTRGALLLKLGYDRDARIAFDKAIALAKSPAEAAHIRMQIDRLSEQKAG